MSSEADTETKQELTSEINTDNTMSVESESETKPGLTSELNTENIKFDELIKNFVKVNKPSVHILTPCFGGMCHVNYVTCLSNTQTICQYYGIELHVIFMQRDSLVTRARNNLIAKSMAIPSMTHIMFIDNDITWDPIDVIKLLLSEKDVVGGIYPLKNYNWDKIIPTVADPNPIQTMIDRKNKSQVINTIPDALLIQNKLLNYNVNYLSDSIQINKNLTQVKHLATGFMMISRNVIEQMFVEYAHLKYVDDVHALVNDTEQSNAYALFDCEVIDNHYYSEDWLFCHRWSQMQGTIWIDISIKLAHTGTEHFNGNYMASLI